MLCKLEFPMYFYCGREGIEHFGGGWGGIMYAVMATNGPLILLAGQVL